MSFGSIAIEGRGGEHTPVWAGGVIYKPLTLDVLYMNGGMAENLFNIGKNYARLQFVVSRRQTMYALYIRF
jgi:hypothetical protein